MGERENGRARGRHARGEGGVRKSFQLAFCECRYFQFVERLPREKDTSPGEKLSVNRKFKIEEMRNTDVVKLHRK